MSNRPRAVQKIVTRVATLLSVAASAWAGGPPSPEHVAKMEQALPAKAAAQPAKPRKLLVLYRTEGFVHSCIPLGNEAIRRLGEKTGAYTATITNDMAVFDEATLFQYDAVVLNNCTRLSFTDPKHRENLLRFVREGGGLVGIHAATDSFYSWDEMAKLIGGQFDGHPWGAGGTWAVKNDDPKHPINEAFGGDGFVIKDEIYQIKGGYSRAAQRVLLSLDWANEMNHKVNLNGLHREDKDFGISWLKPCEKGRIFYCSMGHNEHIYWDERVLKHYLAGIQYALGDLKVDDQPSRPSGLAP